MELPTNLKTIELIFEADTGILWCHMLQRPRQAATPQLLADLINVQKFVADTIGKEAHPIKAFALASRNPKVFCSGGDLELFSNCVTNNDSKTLTKYAHDCIKVVSQFHDLPIPTFALVRGAALGGGFELALAADTLVVEKGSMLHFPEWTIGLFPGMGAVSFLARLVGMDTAQSMLVRSKPVHLNILKELGIVDSIVPRGEGENAIRSCVQSAGPSPVKARKVCFNSSAKSGNYAPLATKLWSDHFNVSHAVNDAFTLVGKTLTGAQELSWIVGTWVQTVIQLDAVFLENILDKVRRQDGMKTQPTPPDYKKPPVHTATARP